MSTEWKYDVYLVHANEDKDGFAAPLCTALQNRAIKVWFDDKQIQLGDDYRLKMEDGLRDSRFGVVILSHNFTKLWAERELSSLLAIHSGRGGKTILPVRYNVTLEDVEKRWPFLRGLHMTEAARGVEAVADEIAEVVQHPQTHTQASPMIGSARNQKNWRWSLLLFLVIVAAAIIGTIFGSARQPSDPKSAYTSFNEAWDAQDYERLEGLYGPMLKAAGTKASRESHLNALRDRYAGEVRQRKLIWSRRERFHPTTLQPQATQYFRSEVSVGKGIACENLWLIKADSVWAIATFYIWFEPGDRCTNEDELHQAIDTGIRFFDRVYTSTTPMADVWFADIVNNLPAARTEIQQAVDKIRVNDVPTARSVVLAAPMAETPGSPRPGRFIRVLLQSASTTRRWYEDIWMERQHDQWRVLIFSVRQKIQ